MHIQNIIAVGDWQAPPDFDDPTRDWAGDIDPEFASLTPDWHCSFDGGPHITVEAFERLSADLMCTSERIGGAA